MAHKRNAWRLFLWAWLAAWGALWILAGPGCDCAGSIRSDVIGDMTVEPASTSADGSSSIVVTVRLFSVGSRQPLQGLQVVLVSDRNVPGPAVDIFEQPGAPTDAEGRAVGFVGSTTPGEARLFAEVGGARVCERFEAGDCVELSRRVAFVPDCPQGQTACGFVCADLESDPAHCGSCDHACDSGQSCQGGQCGEVCADRDRDGHGDVGCGGDDCNDQNDRVYPGADEGCDFLDNDCDGATDEEPDATASCDDGDPCTVSHACIEGVCRSQELDVDQDGYPPEVCAGGDCDDGNPDVHPGAPEIGGVTGTCLDGIDNDCDGRTDAQEAGCNPCTVDADCDDGDACNGAESCHNPVCQPGTAIMCDDINPCTDDRCDPATGQCRHVDNTRPCDDGNRCTRADSCLDGACRGGLPVDCDDQEACTSDSCVPATGCVHEPVDGPCDDGNACSIGDACFLGACQPGSQTLDCRDGNDCTDDVCEPSAGCVFVPNTNPCDDFDACTSGDRCLGGACMGGTATSCDDGNDCTDDACDPGTGRCMHLANQRRCDDANPCTMQDTCRNGRCQGVPLDEDGDGFPTMACGYTDCDDGSTAINPGVFEGPAGAGVCSDGLDNDCDGQTDGSDPTCRPCSRNEDCDDLDVCNGVETCQASACVPGARLDCDDRNPCTSDNCDPVRGCFSLDNADPCDDGDACTLNDTCERGLCAGQEPVQCQPLDQCHVSGQCDSVTGQCTNPVSPDGIPCDDRNLCTRADSCQRGRCIGSDPVVCAALDQCHDPGTCNPATGVCNDPARPNGVGCNDGNACTRSDTCQSGECFGSNPVVCTPLDQCHSAGVCDPVTGVCSQPVKPDGTPCDLGNRCYRVQECQEGACQGSQLVECEPQDACHLAGTCDPATGTCSNPPSPEGSSCDDGNACTRDDTCHSGICSGGDPVECQPLDECHMAGICNPATGTCSNPLQPDGTACNDGNPCSSVDTCQAGGCLAGATDLDLDRDGHFDRVCPGGDDCADGDPLVHPGMPEGPVGDGTCFDGKDNNCNGFIDLNDPHCRNCIGDTDCNDNNPCTTDRCLAGACQNTFLPDGSACSDGNACTRIDACQGGVCQGSNPVVCTPLDQCHFAGTCNPATGTCSDPIKPDGTACDDANACTRTDTCQGGSCAGANPVTCTPLDQCHLAGTCNPATGVCSNPSRPDGAPCNDGNACTQTDTCLGGSCSGSNPVVCSPLDDCHLAGTCNPSSGTCSNPVKPDGSACVDGNACTLTDTCQSGSCVGANPVTCTPLDQCHLAGTCNPATGVCSNPNRPDGSSCNDGNICSSSDTCQSGVCTAGATDRDADSDGYFDRLCPSGTDCDDARPLVNPGATEGPFGSPSCTDTLDNDCDNQTDMTDTGCMQCFSHGDCNDNNSCTTDLCQGGVCTHAPVANGTSCNDGNLCTQTDTCQSGSCTGANPVVCTQLDQCHDAGTCNPATGACSNPTKPDGTSCNDGDLCTQTDTCQSGSCTGANPVVCAPLDQCHNAGTCNPATGQCSNPTKPDGTSCNDGNLCTQTDTCQSGTCTGSNPVVCSPLDQCHNAGTCNPATGQCSNPEKPNGTACNDGNPCSTLDTCQGGTCTAGATNKDSDGDGYFDKACPNGTDCDDTRPLVNPGVVEGPYGNAKCSDSLDNDCDTFVDMNDTGCMQCQNPSDCNDNNTCTTDNCVGGVCQYGNVANGTGCNDGNGCTQTDTCQNGVCIGNNPIVCTPLSQCHNAGTCNPATGQCSNPTKPDGTSCNDGQACTYPDTCQTGVCAGVAYSCDDHMPCTDDSCNGDGTCAHNSYPNPSGHPDFQYVETRCDTIDNDCDGCVDEGCPGYSNPIIAADVIPFSTQPGLRRLSGNAQFGPHSAILPNPLLVQLNDGAGNPIAGQLVNFTVAGVGTVCFGDAQTQYNCQDSSSDRICPMNILKDCNNTLGVLIDHLGNEASSLDVPTDANGQARVRLRMPTSDTGLVVVSASANAQTVHFFAGSAIALASTITVPTSTMAAPPTNPAFGPLIQTKWSNDSQAPTYLADFNSYTLTITGLSASTGATSGVPSAPLAGGGTLTITGTGFASGGNTVWVGGVPVTPSAQSTTTITVPIPEGLPGAAPVAVNDGTTTICKNQHGTADGSANNFGNLPSTVVAPANFWRLASKPIFIYADTGALDGSEANVKLLGLDMCGNPLSLAGHTISLSAFNPDKATPSNAVSIVSGPHATTGVATVRHLSSVIRSAVLIGTVDGLSSDSLQDGNTVVATVPRMQPATFTDMGLGNNNGVNSLIVRGADETNTQSRHLNPGIRLSQNNTYQSFWQTAYAVASASETECNLWLGNLTGQGNSANLPTTLGVTYFTAVAGTFLGTITGGAQLSGSAWDLGMVAVMAARVGINPSLASPTVFDVPAMIYGGWLHSPNATNQQVQELFYNALTFLTDSSYPPGYPRELIVRIILGRTMP